MTFHHNPLEAAEQEFLLAKAYWRAARGFPDGLGDAEERLDAARKLYFGELFKRQPTRGRPFR